MTVQYIRKVSLTVGNATKVLDLSALHFRFTVLRGDLQTPNSVDVRVYNVSEDTLNTVRKEFTKLTLQAGYEGNFGVIFSGTIKQVRRGRENATDSYMDLTAADGDSAYNFAIVNKSLKAGSTPEDHFNVVLGAMKQ